MFFILRAQLQKRVFYALVVQLLGRCGLGPFWF